MRDRLRLTAHEIATLRLRPPDVPPCAPEMQTHWDPTPPRPSRLMRSWRALGRRLDALRDEVRYVLTYGTKKGGAPDDAV